ncbi:hypothetical protein FB451DRAFT_1553615 [Mycena latifolia]|nr:hypothetical protein FB451DRAFT_1553615 [Mycena latifolia]
MANPSPFPPTPAELEELLLLVHDARTTSYLAVAALALLIYDHILSLDHEIEFVWNKRKSFGGYLYLWNRYWTLIITCINTSVVLREITSDKVCRNYFEFESLSATLTVATIDLILLMRVWILFGRSRRLLYILASVMLVELCIMFTIAVLVTRSGLFVHIGAILPGCYATGGVPKYLTFYAVPSLVVTSVMFVMTVYNCTTRLGFRLSFSSRSTMPLINLFLRDGIFWFLAVVAVNPPQLIVWAVGRTTLVAVLLIPAMVVYSIIGSRVLLNIKEIMTHGVANREIITL